MFTHNFRIWEWNETENNKNIQENSAKIHRSSSLSCNSKSGIWKWENESVVWLEVSARQFIVKLASLSFPSNIYRASQLHGNVVIVDDGGQCHKSSQLTGKNLCSNDLCWAVNFLVNILIRILFVGRILSFFIQFLIKNFNTINHRNPQGQRMKLSSDIFQSAKLLLVKVKKSNKIANFAVLFPLFVSSALQKL